MNTNSASTFNLFTPSEIVLLNGERFASKAGLFDKVRLMQGDKDVSLSSLSRMMLIAAFLGCETTGSIRLSIQQKKTFLGLSKTNILVVEPTEIDFDWPQGSFESRIKNIAVQMKAEQNKPEVSDIVYNLLGSDSANPWQQTMELVQAGLAQRSLLITIEEKKLKIFTSTRYELPQSTASLASNEPVDELLQTIKNSEKNQLEEWKLLVGQINSGVKSRTEQDESPDFD